VDFPNKAGMNISVGICCIREVWNKDPKKSLYRKWADWFRTGFILPRLISGERNGFGGEKFDVWSLIHGWTLVTDAGVAEQEAF